MPAIIGGALAGGGALLGAGSSLLGAGKASSASKAAAGQQLQMYYANRATAQPYFTAGDQAVGNALNLTQGSPAQIQSQLEQLPGYQFALSQGLKTVQSAAAARGLGMSGASLKGAAAYATGLANQTYGDQFNRLMNLSSLGENAAVGIGNQGTQAAATAGNFTNQAGLASAAGTTGVSNALTGGVNNYLAYNALQNALNPQGGTAGYGSSAAGTPGISASGNPVMTGFIGNQNIGSPGNYVPPV